MIIKKFSICNTENKNRMAQNCPKRKSWSRGKKRGKPAFDIPLTKIHSLSPLPKLQQSKTD